MTFSSSIHSLRSSVANRSASLLVIFDSRVADLDVLYAALYPGALAYTLASEADALVVITQLLAETGAKHLAMVAHGEPGVVHLGAKPLNREQLEAQSHLLQEWGVEEVALYSCEVAQGKVGQSLVAQLEELTGARVAAASGKVGDSKLGGSWDLKMPNGKPLLHFQPTVLENYQAILNEFRVNSFTGSDQVSSSVTALSDGTFLVTWSSWGQDGSGWGIFGRRFSANGTPLTGEFLINNYAGSNQLNSSATALSDGSFVVTWTSENHDGSGLGVIGRRFSASGVPLTGEFLVNSHTPNAQFNPSIAALPDNSFVITWSSLQDGSSFGIYGRRFSSSGTPLTGEFPINTYIPNDQLNSSVTTLSDGSFVVTWSSLGQDGSGWGIFGRRFSSSGTPLTGEFLINSNTSSDQKLPSVTSLSDGGFVVTWSSSGQDGSGWGIFGRRFSASGAPISNEFSINTFTNSDQLNSSVTALSNNGFVVTWSSFGQDGSGWGIYGQRFSSSGTAVGGEFLINQTQDGSQQNSGYTYSGYSPYDQNNYYAGSSYSVDQLSDGSLVATWYGSGSGDTSGIFARVFTPPSFSSFPAPITYTDTASNDVFVPISGTITATDSYGGSTLTYGIAGGTGGVSLVQNLVVNSQQNDVLSGQPRVWSAPLTAGVQYQIIVSGTWRPDINNPAWNVDARYVTPNGWSFFQDSDPFGYGDLGLYSDRLGGDDFWGAYRNDHTYSVIVTGQGAPLDFYIRGDGFTGNNQGSYQIAIYQVQPATQVGTYGMLSLNPLTGQYTYTPNDSAIEAARTNATESFTITVRDNAGASQSQSLNVNINGANDTPILVNALVNQTATQDAPFNFQFPISTFSDVDAGDSLTYSASLSDGSPLPSWVTFDPATRTFSGTPANTSVGALNLRVTATDLAGASVSSTFTMTIGNINDAPTVANPIAPQNIAEDVSFAFTIPDDTFADADAGDLLSYSVSLSDGSPLPSWLSYDATARQLRGTPTNDDVGTISLRVTATDTSGASASSTFDVTVGNINDAPILVNPIAPQSVAEDTPFTFTIPASTFTDVDAGDTLTYSARLSDGSPLPAWLSFNATTRTLSGTSPQDFNGTLSLQITATDSGSLSAFSTFDLTIAGVNDAPALTGTQATLANGAEDTAYTISAASLLQGFTDADGDTLSISNLTATNGTLVNHNDGTYTFTPNVNFNGAINLSYNVIDGKGGSVAATQSFSIAAVNDAPVVSNTIASQTATEDLPFSFTVPANAFADPDGDTLTYTATLADDSPLPSWITFDPATRTFSGTPGDADLTTVNLKVTATDPSGRAVSQVFQVAVNSIDDPTIIAAPDQQTVNEDTSLVFSSANGNAITLSDADSGNSLLQVSLLMAAPGSLSLGDTSGLSNVSEDGTSFRGTLAAINAALEGLSFSPSRDYNGTANLQLMVSNSDTGVSTSKTISIQVTPVNDAPVLNLGIAPTVNEGEPFSFSFFAATDPDDRYMGTIPITYSARLANGAALPAWISFAPSTRTFNGTPTSVHIGSLNIEVTASDGQDSASQVFTLTVADVNNAPTAVVLSNPVTELAENSEIGQGIKVADIAITDDALGTNTLSLEGPNRDSFAIRNNALYYVGNSPDFETQSSYAVTVVATDAALNASARQIFTLSIQDVNETLPDTTPPDAPMIANVALDNTVNSTEKAAGVAVTGTAEANSTVRISWGSTTLETTADASGAWSQIFSSGQLPSDGTTTLSVTATDAAGNTSSGSTRSIRIDTVAPNAPSITNVTDNQGTIQGTVANAGFTDDTTPTLVIGLTGTNAIAGDTVRLFNGATEIATQVLTAANITARSVSITPAALSDGLYSVTARVADAAGNRSAASSLRTFTVDTAIGLPTINVVSNDNRISSTEKSAGVSVTGTAEAGSTVTVVWGSTSLTATANSSGNWSRSFSATQIPADGTTTITATARDRAGNTNSSVTRTVVIDTGVPNAPAIIDVQDNVGLYQGTVANSSFTNDTTPSFTIDLTATNAVAGDAVRLFNGTTAILTQTLTEADIASSRVALTPATALAQGNYTISARIQDIAGNQSAASTARTFIVDTAAPTTPTLALATDSGRSTSDRVTNVGVINVSRLETGATWQYSLNDGQDWVEGAGSNLTLTGDGAKRVIVRQIDQAGNISANSTPFSFTLDTTAPQTPVVNSYRNSSGNSLTLVGTAEPGSTITVLNGPTTVGTATTASSGAWSFSTANLVNGSFNVVVRSTDIAGNATSMAAIPLMAGDAIANSLVGGSGSEILLGYDGADTITGNEGDDWLIGGSGSDLLTGGIGADRFDLSRTRTTGADTATDFNAAEDRLLISRAEFGLTQSVGILDASLFGLGTSATTTAQRFLYDSTTGNLVFDSNGSSSGGQVRIATLSNRAALSHTQIEVIA